LAYNILYGLKLATHRITNHFLMQIIFICKSYFTKIQNIEDPNNCNVTKRPYYATFKTTHHMNPLVLNLQVKTGSYYFL